MIQCTILGNIARVKMITKTPVLRTLALLPLIGCMADNVDPGGQDGENPHVCSRIEADLAFDESSVLGFSAADALASIHADTDSPLYYVDMSTTDLTFEVVADKSKALHVELEGCGQEAVVFEVTVSLITDDGLFDEQFTGEIWAWSEDYASTFASVAHADLGGSYTLDPTDTSGWNDLAIDFQLEFHTWGPQGSIRWTGNQTDTNTAMQTSGDIAAWNGGEESPW